MHLRSACLAFLVLLFTSGAAAEAASTPTPSLTLVQKSFAYTPSTVAAALFTGLYGLTTLVIFSRLFANRTWWGLCLPIGTTVMTVGFLLRVAMLLDPNSSPIYLCSTLFVLLSPAAFLAFNYILYGRFVASCIERRHSLIRPERTARYFVVSDVSTLFIQGSGGSLLASTHPYLNTIGYYVVIAGLALQTVSYAFYVSLVLYTLRSLKRDGVLKPFNEPWGAVLKLILFSSAFFLFRCVYRTVELGQGLHDGYFTRHEVFFYLFDSLPLLVGVHAYAVFWPSRYIPPTIVTPGRFSTDEMRQSIAVAV